jgi:hypothetical protein
MSLVESLKNYVKADKTLVEGNYFSSSARFISCDKLTLEEQKELIEFLLGYGSLVYRYSAPAKRTDNGHLYISMKCEPISFGLGAIVIPAQRKARRENGLAGLFALYIDRTLENDKNKLTEKLNYENKTLLAYALIEAKKKGIQPIGEKNFGRMPPAIYDTWDKIEVAFELDPEKTLEKLRV